MRITARSGHRLVSSTSSSSSGRPAQHGVVRPTVDPDHVGVSRPRGPRRCRPPAGWRPAGSARCGRPRPTLRTGSSLRRAAMTRSTRSRPVTATSTRSPRSSIGRPTRGWSSSSISTAERSRSAGQLVVGEDGPDPPTQGPEPAAAQLGAAGRPQDLGELVGLVEHHRHRARATECPAGGQAQPVVVLVGDHDVGRRRPLAGLLGEAVGPLGAAGRPRALVGPDRDRRPDVVRGSRIELLPVAVGRLGGPGPDLGQVVVGVAPAEELELFVSLGPLQLGQALAAQVVAAALEQGHGDRPIEGLGHHGHVAVDQLGLQGDGGRCHHGSLAAGHDGHQVGQRLSGAGTGLDQQVSRRWPGSR